MESVKSEDDEEEGEEKKTLQLQSEYKQAISHAHHHNSHIDACIHRSMCAAATWPLGWRECRLRNGDDESTTKHI